MKKHISILCTTLTICSILAASYVNWNHVRTEDLDLVYKIDSRFGTTVTKERLHQVTSILDIIPEEANWSNKTFQTVTVGVLQHEDEMLAFGDNKMLNTAQTELLQSADYSTNFYIKARGTGNHLEAGEIGDYVYYFTIVPEQEAAYTDGDHALIEYLKENSQEKTRTLVEDKLKPGRIHFTIARSGTIENVNLTSTSGYSSIDKMMIDLISNMPGVWSAATNSEGEKVDQELVFFFGRQGC